MKLDQAITDILELTGGKPELAEKIVLIFKRAGCPVNVPETTMNKVLTAAKALNRLGVK